MENSTNERVDLWKIFQNYTFNFLNNKWKRLPKKVGFVIAAILAVVAIPFFRGNWMFISVCASRQFSTDVTTANKSSDHSNLIPFDKHPLQNLGSYLISSVATAFLIYFPVGTFYHWYFYYRQRDNSEEWKIQPKKFLTWDQQRDEIILGVTSLSIGSFFSGLVTCYLSNGGPMSTLYYNVSEMGYFYYILSIPILFLYVDASVYYAHKMFHIPFLYRTIHKYHHKFKQPTPFSATAMHPLEILTYELLSYVPLFTLPIHWTVFAGHSLYVFYYSLEAHCGVKVKSIWPWQPTTEFHDQHHQYTHYNFGFNTVLWDKIHKTYRLKKD